MTTVDQRAHMSRSSRPGSWRPHTTVIGLAAGLVALVGVSLFAQRNTDPRVLPRRRQLELHGLRPDHQGQREEPAGRLVLSATRPRRSVRSPSTACCTGWAATARRSSRSTPTTGKEIWVHEGLNGIVSKGINFWQSEDGKDRRLLFSVNSFLQAIDARTGKSILTSARTASSTCASGCVVPRARARAPSRTVRAASGAT